MKSNVGMIPCLGRALPLQEELSASSDSARFLQSPYQPQQEVPVNRIPRAANVHEIEALAHTVTRYLEVRGQIIVPACFNVRSPFSDFDSKNPTNMPTSFSFSIVELPVGTACRRRMSWIGFFVRNIYARSVDVANKEMPHPIGTLRLSRLRSLPRRTLATAR